MEILDNYNIDDATKVMLSELKDECFRYIKLTDQIELDELTENQLSNILGELTASVTHLNIHSESLKVIIEV
ncbi:MAG: hypothetical protein OMM_06449 [Candidatus Magnetoglobus multicellularis str. Araruama]|uniref:Uncharacterized protein n=1 Tax=Candidatus Magnetoglobus multicellularis str. Araruama TaxID=890399 RepID=A0A1V1PHK0_9BACT|nr:MAG: hypothetical protein OMM_06449 [Candidatus Magnetoglobus multicellularis str. Araruama]